MFQYVYAQIVSDNNSERMTKIEKKIVSWTAGNSVVWYNKIEANLQRIFNSYVKIKT